MTASDEAALSGAVGIAPEIARRAVEWLVELQSAEANDDTHRAFKQWLHQHPDHERAWRHIETVNHRLRRLSGASALVHATLIDTQGAARRSLQRRTTIKILAVLLVGAGAWAIQAKAPWDEWLADERTEIGEQRTVTLADATTVALNTDSAIDVRFSAGERRVRFVNGEILINTGKDPAGRPFVVETAEGELRPLGTRFSVRQMSDAARVSVFEGAVEIHPRDGAAKGRVLGVSEQARFTHSAIGEVVPADDSANAWTEGILVASGMPLCEFLAEIGRYRHGRITCDPAIAGLRVSGTYPLADTDRVLEALRVTLPVEIRYRTRYWVTVRPVPS
jgi:transmembrane sensor